jgi:hypothetical protein
MRCGDVKSRRWKLPSPPLYYILDRMVSRDKAMRSFSLFTRARILISHTADTRTSSVYLQFVYNLVVFVFLFLFLSFSSFLSLSPG